MNFNDIETLIKMNPACIFSYENKNENNPTLILNRRPIRLSYDWASLYNKKIYFKDNIVHASLTLSPDIVNNKNIFKKLSIITMLKIDKSKIPSLKNKKLIYNGIEESINLTKMNYEKIIESNNYKNENIKDYIDKVNEASKIHIICQGTTNLNGVIDIYVSYIEFSDGIFGNLTIKVYYNTDNSNHIRRQTINVPLNNEEFLNEFETFSCSIDSDNSNVKVFENTKLLYNTYMNPLDSYKNILNYPFNDSDDNIHLRIGDEKLNIKYFSLYDETISSIYLNQIKDML